MKKLHNMKYSKALAGWSSIMYDKDTGQTIRLGTIWIWKLN